MFPILLHQRKTFPGLEKVHVEILTCWIVKAMHHMYKQKRNEKKNEKRKLALICYLGFPTSWIGNKRLSGGGLCRCLAKRWQWTTLNSGSKSCRALRRFPNVSINCMYQAGMHNHMFWCFVFWSQRSCNTFAATKNKSYWSHEHEGGSDFKRRHPRTL